MQIIADSRHVQTYLLHIRCTLTCQHNLLWSDDAQIDVGIEYGIHRDIMGPSTNGHPFVYSDLKHMYRTQGSLHAD